MEKKVNLSDKFRYTKMFLEIALEYAYDVVYSRKDGQILYSNPNIVENNDCKHLRKRVILSDSDFEKIISQENGIFFTPVKREEYYRPNTAIKNFEEFENSLKEYLKTINSCDKSFYKFDKEHSMSTYLYYLVKTLTNSDSQDFNQYVKTFIGFLKDDRFVALKRESKIGEIKLEDESEETYDILAKRAEEYYGSETPYTMRFWMEKKGFKYTMPFVRYGIDDKNGKAYIYSIQRKGKLKRGKNIKEINGRFNRVNSGVKQNRDITPSMLISATMFLGMCKGIGLENIKVADFLTRRFGYYRGAIGTEEAMKLQENITNKFLRTFSRLVSQFDGIDIVSYPNDYDSYFNLRLGKNISSTNKLLNDFFQVGYRYGKNQKSLIDIER